MWINPYIISPKPGTSNINCQMILGRSFLRRFLGNQSRKIRASPKNSMMLMATMVDGFILIIYSTAT